MSKYSDAQYDLIYSIIEDIAESKDFTQAEIRQLTNAVFADDDLWSGDIWNPIVEFIADYADDIELQREQKKPPSSLST